jgi:hypothetical protein
MERSRYCGGKKNMSVQSVYTERDLKSPENGSLSWVKNYPTHKFGADTHFEVFSVANMLTFYGSKFAFGCDAGGRIC